MSVTAQEIVRLFLGRGIRGEIVEEATGTVAARMELHIDLPALQVELEQAMLNFDAAAPPRLATPDHRRRRRPRAGVGRRRRADPDPGA